MSLYMQACRTLIQIILRETETILDTATVVNVVNIVSRRQFLFNYYIQMFHCFDILTKCEISPNGGDKSHKTNKDLK